METSFYIDYLYSLSITLLVSSSLAYNTDSTQGRVRAAFYQSCLNLDKTERDPPMIDITRDTKLSFALILSQLGTDWTKFLLSFKDLSSTEIFDGNWLNFTPTSQL